MRSGLVGYHDHLADLLVDIDSITPHPRNPNNGDLDAITASIETNGMYRPVFVHDATGHIIAGNHTWAACKQLGATQIPVIRLQIDEHTALRIMLADNRTAALAVPDNALLLELLDTLAATDSLLGTGYADYDHEAIRHLVQMEPDYDEHATWPLIQVRVPPHVKDAYLRMTEQAVGDRERFELLLRLAGWTP